MSSSLCPYYVHALRGAAQGQPQVLNARHRMPKNLASGPLADLHLPPTPFPPHIQMSFRPVASTTGGAYK
jgi:hypothetical protein